MTELVASWSCKNQGRIEGSALILLRLAALGLAACHLFDFALLRSASVVAGLERVVGLTLLTRRPFGFLAFVFTERGSICHRFISLS